MIKLIIPIAYMRNYEQHRKNKTEADLLLGIKH